MTRKKTKALFAVIAARVIGVSISFLMNILVTRWVNVNEAGIFFTSFSIIMLWGLIGTSGFCDAILIMRPQLIATRNYIQASSLALFGALIIIVISCLLSGAIYLFLTYGESLKVYGALYICASIPLLSMIQYTGYIFQTNGRSLLSVIIINISYPLIFSFIVLVCAVLHMEANALNLVKFLFLSIILSFIFCAVLWKKYIFTNINAVVYLKKLKYKYIITTLLSFLLILICNTIIQWITPIISNYYISSEDVALVSVCLRIGLVISFFLISLNVVFAPNFSKLYTEGKFDELKLMVRSSTRLVVILSLPGVAFLLLFPEFVLSIFGREYTQASIILRIVCIGQLINVLTGSVAFLLTMTGNEKIFRNIIFFNAFMMIINLNFMGGGFGIKGIACAVALSVIIQNVIAVYFVKRKLDINILDYFYLK